MTIGYKECKFYIKGGKCSHKDAPNPRHSSCMGKELCGAWEDGIEYEVKEGEEK